ncbi:non-LEE-encoded type III secreted effector [Escherichia coli]|uniref:Non-LEE-encoded type III secreted effector n=1 Tax=Escherichia coli TaxID=562 RepID=A0A376U9I7_ECOLX|nr:non-LEE-encoded type III secreted effector [Escherichia coli]
MKLSKKIHREKTIHPTVNLNGSACFLQSPSDAIFCRHLSLQYALDSLRNGKGKVNLIKHYSSVESIQQHIPLVRDAEFRALLRHPPAGSRVIASKDFGFALDIFFCRMMANNVSHMSAILYIDNHTLSVRLRIKQSVYGQLIMLCLFTTRTIPTLPSEAPTGQHGAFSRLISSSVQLPMLRPGLIGMFATVQLLFFLYYLREFQLLF